MRVGQGLPALAPVIARSLTHLGLCNPCTARAPARRQAPQAA